MGILSNIGLGANNISKAVKNGIEKTGKFLWSYATEGYSASAVHTMPEHDPLEDQNRATKKHGVFVSILPFITFYIPGLIAGATIVPLIYLTNANFNRYRKLPNNRIKYYRKPKRTRKPDELDDINYAAGPSPISRIFGIIGAPLGLIIGTIFAPDLYKGILQETVHSFWNIWGQISFELTRADERISEKIHFQNTLRQQYGHELDTSTSATIKDSLTEIFRPFTRDQRSTLAKILGYIPFGIPLSIAAFAIIGTGHTLARIAVNSWYSLANSFVFILQKSLFDTSMKPSTPYPAPRNTYKQALGLTGLIIGSAIGTVVGGIVIGGRIIWESTVNFVKWLSKGFHAPLSDDRFLKVEPYEFTYEPSKLKLTDPKTIGQAFNLSWKEHLLGAPGYLLAPVAATLGFLGGSAVRIAGESFFSTYNTGVAIISRTALRAVKNYSQPAFVENRKWYEHAVGILGYPVGLITLPFAALILSARYLITNYDTANRSFYFLSNPIMQPKDKLKTDERAQWVKVISAPGAILGATLGSLVRITGESVHTSKQLVKTVIKGALTDAPRSLRKHRLLNTNVSQPSANTKYWGFPGSIIGVVIAVPTAAVILLGRFTLTNGTSFKREFAKQVNPKITTEERKIFVTEQDERTPRLIKAGTPGYALGWLFGKLGNIAVDSRAHLEYAVMRSMQIAAHEHPLQKHIKLNEHINSHSPWTGGPGMVLGYIAGFIAAGVFATGRILYNTADSIRHVTLDMIRFVRHNGEKFPEAKNFVMLSRLKKSTPRHIEPAEVSYGDVHTYEGVFLDDSDSPFPSISSEQGFHFTSQHPTKLSHSEPFSALQQNRSDYTSDDDENMMLPRESSNLSGSDSDSSTEFTAPPSRRRIIRNVTNQKKPRQDKRLNTPFRLGVLGIPLGGVVGLLAAGTVGFLRFLAQTTVTAWNVSLIITRKSLPEKEYYNIDEILNIKQTKVDKAMGTLGVLPGLGLGFVGFAIGGTLRTLVNTGITLSFAVYQIATLPPVSEYLPKLEDNRERTDKILGAPLGYLLSLPLGLVFYSLHITAHVIIDSCKTGYHHLHKMIPWSMGDRRARYLLGQDPHENLHVSNDQAFASDNVTPRNFKERNVFGFFGHVIGGALGVAISSVIISGRVLFHSLVRSTVIGFTQFTNLAKTKNMKELPNAVYDKRINKIALPILKKPLTVPAKVLSGLKYIIGLPGLALGTTVSAVFWIMPNYAYEAYKENVKSYGHLARSLVNLGGEALYFRKGGLAADTRSWQRKAVGTPGYLLALATAGLVPLANAVIIKLPSLIIGIIGMPFVAVYKTVKAIRTKKANAEKDTPLYRATEIRKMLYLGELDEVYLNSSNGIGMQGTYFGVICDSLRRLISFDQDSYTEALVAARFAYESNNDEVAYESAINKIKDDAHAMHIPKRDVREQYNADINDEITSVNNWITDFVERNIIDSQAPKKTYTRNTLLFFKDPGEGGMDSEDGINLDRRENPWDRRFT